MRTVGKGSIIELNSHIKRITTSLSLMKFTQNENENELDHVTQQLQSFRDVDLFEEKLVPMIRQGLESFYDYDPTVEETKVAIMVTYSFDVSCIYLCVCACKILK